jgi:hypothetical protein
MRPLGRINEMPDQLSPDVVRFLAVRRKRVVTEDDV